VLTRRAPDARESADIAYGREIARQIAGLDLGQTVVVRDRACVAVEAMEGTDETIERAARIAEEGSLVVVKVSKPRQDMRFDVPVVGLRTVEVMSRCRVSALGMDAGRTLLSTARASSTPPMPPVSRLKHFRWRPSAWPNDRRHRGSSDPAWSQPK